MQITKTVISWVMRLIFLQKKYEGITTEVGRKTAGLNGRFRREQGSGQSLGAGCCKCGNEPSGLEKCGEYLDYLRTRKVRKRGCTPFSCCVSWNLH